MEITIIDALRDVLSLAEENAKTGRDNDSIKMLKLLFSGHDAKCNVDAHILDEDDLEPQSDSISYRAEEGSDWSKLKNVEEVCIDIRTGNLDSAMDKGLYEEFNGSLHKAIRLTFISKIK